MNTPLHKAAWKGDEAKVIALIGGGADVNATNKSGSTPLHSALYFDTWTYSLMPTTFPTSIWASAKKYKRAEAKFRIATLLLEKGCDDGLKNKFGLTPLDIAPKLGPLAIVGLVQPMKWLVERDGARWDPTQTYPNDNRMPLFGAAWCGKNWNVGKAVSQPVLEGKVETIMWLVRQGCSPDHKDKEGVSPRNVCDVTYWMDAKAYSKIMKYEPAIWLQLKLAMNAPLDTGNVVEHQPQQQPMMLQIPAGVVSGGQFQVQTPSGAMMMVTCPPESRAGDTIQIMGC